MFERFNGENGRRLRIEALSRQRMVQGSIGLATELADRSIVRRFSPGEILIEQGGSDNQVYFILSGTVTIVVNGRSITDRAEGNHVGEMAAIEPMQRRSASVIAKEEVIVAEIEEVDFSEIASRYPEIYRQIAREVSRRLYERNRLVTATHEKIRLFVMCSAEALDIARAVQSAFQHDNFLTTIWTDGVFKTAHYPLESLERQVDQSDFAVAIAYADDLTLFRGKEWPTPRDNVVFELGLFMGKLGRKRAILMEPRADKVKLPSDVAGVTTIAYNFQRGSDTAALIAPACNELRSHINALGPNN